jgi:hypothetical protein
MKKPSTGKLLIGGLTIVLVGHIVFALTYQWLIPLGYGPDEPRHYGYIQHLVLYRSLPVLGDPSHPYYCHMDPRPPNAIGIHPPLYYALLAPIYTLVAGQRIDHPQANQTPFQKLPPSRSLLVQHILRTLSLLMSLVTLWLIAQTALLFFDCQSPIAIRQSLDAWWLLGMVGFLAWLPHFLMLSAVMNNDTLTILLGHLFLFLLAKQTISASNLPSVANRQSPVALKEAAALGFVFGLLGLSKASALAWLPLLLLGTWQIAKRSHPHQRWQSVAIALSLPVLICGWWYVRFYLLYGRLMPIVKWTENPELLLNSLVDLIWRPDAWFLVWRFLLGVARSLWGQVDWFILKPEHVAAWRQKFGTPAETAYPLTEPLWLLAVLLSLSALIGWLVRFVRWVQITSRYSPVASRKLHISPKHQAGAFLILGFVLLFLALMHYTLFTHPGGYEGGRYLLPSIGGFAFLFWQGLFGIVPERWRPALVCFVLALLLALNIGCVINLHNFLNPLYAPS